MKLFFSRLAWPCALRRRLLSAGAALLLAGLAACSSAPPRPPAAASASVAPAALSEEQSQAVTLYALGLVGTPYRYGGNTPDSGFDCSGLIRHVYGQQAGLPAPRTVAQLQGWGHAVPIEALRTGDLVLFSNGGAPSHAGIYVGEGRFVHAPSTGGQVRLDRLRSPYWSQQQVAVRRP